MSLLIMQHSVDFDLEEIESRLYSQVFHSTENWDQTPNHPVLNKVPERERQVSTYSISNQTVNTTRYWDDTTHAKTHTSLPSSNENAVNDSAVIVNETTENITKPNETNDNDNILQNNNEKNTSRKVGTVEEYIELDSTNNQNVIHTSRNDKIDFTKDDFHHQQNFFYNSQDKLIQQSEIEKTPKNLNNNTSTTTDESDRFADLINNIKTLKQQNTVASKRKVQRLKRKLKDKQLKHERRVKRQLKEQAKEERRLRKLGVIPNNNLQSFSFVNQFNNIQRKSAINQNFIVYNSPEKSDRQSPIVKQIEINECTKNQQEIINDSVEEDSLVILSDSDSDSDEVIEVPLPEEEIVCIDSSSENSDTDDTICVDDNIVENIPSNIKTSNSITEENNVPNSPKLENSNDYETTEIISESQLKIDGEIINNTKNEQILNSEEDKIEEIKVMKDIEENATTLSENEDNIDETTKSPKQTTNNNNTSNNAINEIETERAELLCTPDSNTNDFMAHDVCNLNKNNFCFNFNLHDSDLDLSGKEITKTGPSITDVYETESSCSEAGTSKNRSYFSEVDFESPIKEIFAEPDLAKFSSFITPIRNRNISNVANSTSDLTPIKTKAGMVNLASFHLDIYNKTTEDPCNNSDEYNSDPTTLPVKKKIKKKKKKAKKKDANESDNKTDENVIQGQTETETADNTEIVNKTTKKNKKKNKAITYEELKHNCIVLNQPDSEKEKMSKTKEKKLKKKNKRKSGQLENVSDTVSSNKKPKNDSETKQNEENKNAESPSEKTSTTTNKDKSESLPKSVSSKPLKELNSTVEYHDKVESYFADDILYEELDKDKTTNNINKTETQIVNDKDNSCNELVNIDSLSSKSETNIETFECMNNFQKSNENETQIINISSDSDAEVIASPNEENTSSSSGNNVVLNIFSPKISNDESNNKNMVANPFSLVQNYEKLNHKKSFKDFYTNDMNAFYNDSWGHEDYDLTAVHQSMPSDFSKWTVNTADQFPAKGKKRGPMCLRCREFGHLQFRCPKIHEAIKCSTCGDSEHTTTRCPKSICTTCRSSTQHHTTSCNNCSNYKTIRCPICNYIGHLSRDCPDLWRRYHLTTNDNNSLVVSNQMLKPPNMLWCSNCANRGHSANNCNYLRTDHFPTYPGIQNYTPVYNNVPSLLDLQPPEQQIPVRIFENVNLSQIRNHRMDLVENNNKKYLNMIKNLRRYVGKSDDDLNFNNRLNYLQNAASSNRFNKRKVGELYKISKILRSSR